MASSSGNVDMAGEPEMILRHRKTNALITALKKVQGILNSDTKRGELPMMMSSRSKSQEKTVEGVQI